METVPKPRDGDQLEEGWRKDVPPRDRQLIINAYSILRGRFGHGHDTATVKLLSTFYDRFKDEADSLRFASFAQAILEICGPYANTPDSWDQDQTRVLPVVDAQAEPDQTAEKLINN